MRVDGPRILRAMCRYFGRCAAEEPELVPPMFWSARILPRGGWQVLGADL